MKIGILETGRPPKDLMARHGSFTAMFIAQLGALDAGFSFEVFSVIDDEFPPSIECCDGWLVTGSLHGVYEELPWMTRLSALIREIAATERPLIGICFGHQIIAAALGGRVEKSDKGWGLGPAIFRLSGDGPWRDENIHTVTITAIHQDQVIELPPGAQRYATSDFCPNAGFTVGRNVMTLQPHPEFTNDFAAQLIGSRKSTLYPDVVADPALEALSQHITGADRDTFAGWMAQFLRQGGLG